MPKPFIQRIPRKPGDAEVNLVITRKGGAGKTTVTVNGAAVDGENTPKIPGADDDNAPVLAASIDPQKSMELWAKRVKEDNLPFDYLSTRGDNEILHQLKSDGTVRKMWVDSPGFIDVDEAKETYPDPLGDGPAAEALREILKIADRAIVPINTEHLTLEPAEYTIERILIPLGIPFLVVINRYDPRDDTSKARPLLHKYIKWCTDRNYPYAPQPIRRYRLHADASEIGLVCTRYKPSGTALRGREDFSNLSLAVNQVAI